MHLAWQEHPLLEGVVVGLSGLAIALLIFIAALAQGWFLWWQLRTRSPLLLTLAWAWCGLLAYGLIAPWLERPFFGGLFGEWTLNTILVGLSVAAAYAGLGIGVRLATMTRSARAPSKRL
jgi:hypothetical protein